jgi:hypothetical protein
VLPERAGIAHHGREWYRRWPDANVGVVTGEISNLVGRHTSVITLM